MSRFGDSRWQRLAVWTGAALAWGSTATAALLESARVDASSNPPATEVATDQKAALPTMPASGLMVIRYVPEPVPEPTVRTITVQQPPPAAPSAAPSAPAPQPASSGS